MNIPKGSKWGLSSKVCKSCNEHIPYTRNAGKLEIKEYNHKGKKICAGCYNRLKNYRMSELKKELFEELKTAPLDEIYFYFGVK